MHRIQKGLFLDVIKVNECQKELEKVYLKLNSAQSIKQERSRKCIKMRSLFYRMCGNIKKSVTVLYSTILPKLFSIKVEVNYSCS